MKLENQICFPTGSPGGPVRQAASPQKPMNPFP